jgi:hypothetical protein
LSHGPQRELPAVAGGVKEEKKRTSDVKDKTYLAVGMCLLTDMG